MRGVYDQTFGLQEDSPGSSPHARGLQDQGGHRGPHQRIIPACAGFTAVQAKVDPGAKDHPRMRGVYQALEGGDPGQVGSSPHARGLHLRQRRAGGHRRIIPACAGFTRRRRTRRRRSSDHPRMRGVYVAGVFGVSGFRRSSPHARGLRASAGRAAAAPGIIPACAGFTCFRDSKWDVSWDHPRMRGVYGVDDSQFLMRWGSSPHARGLPDHLQGAVDDARIIPACAGFTCDWRHSAVSQSDHPRMRGVYSGSASCQGRSMGSSPHARGLPQLTERLRDITRIIPACAGFTAPGGATPARPRDHPRMRGVYADEHLGDLAARGSSPHARGLPMSRM